MNTDNNTFELFAEACYVFNEVAEKSTKVSFSDIYQQYKLIEEELKETKDALATNNPQEVLDGAIDVLVTTIGLLQKLENLGVNVSRGLTKTAVNNMTKFVYTEADALETVDMYDKQKEDVFVTYNAKHDCFVIKDKHDKVRKPSTFLRNTLDDCIPDNLKEGFEDFSTIVDED